MILTRSTGTFSGATTRIQEKFIPLTSMTSANPGKVGGLGLRKAWDFNQAFLTKMAWQVFTNQSKLWVKVLRDKYVKEAEFFQLPASVNESWG